MNEADREEIDRLKDELEQSGVDHVSRLRGHRALVLSANAANGCKTVEERTLKLAESMHALCVFMVGFAAGAPASAELSARKAVADCPMRSAHAAQEAQDTVSSLSVQPWERVVKATFLRSPAALAAVVIALILRGFGPMLLKAMNIE
jgi:hypothetical protein